MEEQAKKTSFKPYLIVLAVALAVIGGLTTYKLYFQQETADTGLVAEEKTADIGAVFSYLEGAVEYKAPDGDWTRAKLSDNLFEGYAVEIVGEGRAIVNLDDGSAIRLNSDSGLTFTSLDPNNLIITNDKGEIYSRVAELDRLYQIEAEGIFYQAMGTAYSTINNEGEKGVKVFESSVKVIGEEEIIVSEGEKYYLEKESNPADEKVIKELVEEEVKNNEFLMWNKEKDQAENKNLGFLDFDKKEKESEAEEVETEESPDSPPAPAGKITLSGSVAEDGVNLSWTAEGLDLSKGFKILRSGQENPVFPGAYYVYLNKGEYKSYKWKLTDGKTWHFRVCQYLGSECGAYSNNLVLTAPYVEEKKEEKEEPVSGVNSIIVSDAGSNKVNWTVDGNSPNGFKIAYSKTPGPTYPIRATDSFAYVSDSKATSATLSAFDGTGTYYVRVCEYLAGKCATYSNEISVTLTAKEKPADPVSSVNSIALTDTGSNKVSWTVDGVSASGFKVVWSKTSGPTYPNRSTDKYVYKSESEAVSADLYAFDGEGTYYVRVCEYLSGKCGTYSNEIQVNLSK